MMLAPSLTDIILAAVNVKICARRAELDALRFGNFNLHIELKEGAPVLLRVQVEETQTKTDLMKEVSPLLTDDKLHAKID